jgi:hypothetical protein
LLEACYRKLLQDIHALKQANKLPAYVRFDDLPIRIDDGSGDADSAECIVRSMMENDVVWHSKCRNAVNSQKVQRAQKPTQKRKNDDATTTTTPAKVLRQDGVWETMEQACFFCEESCENGRQVSSKKVDKKVRKAAEALGDGKLLGKLLHRDMIAMKASYHPACLTALCRNAEDENQREHKCS